MLAEAGGLARRRAAAEYSPEELEEMAIPTVTPRKEPAEEVTRMPAARPRRAESAGDAGLLWDDDGIFSGSDAPALYDEMIVGVLPETGAGMLTGQSQMLKSFVLVDVLATIAAREGKWAGREVMRRGGVAYLGYESTATIPGRLWAKLQSMGARGRDLPIAAPKGLKRFTGAYAFGELEESLARLSDRFWDEYGVPLIAVGVDTVAASGLVPDEMDTAAWQDTFNRLNEICERLQIVIILTMHAGKDGSAGARGSSASFAGAEFEIMLSGHRNAVTGEVVGRLVSVTKNKSGDTGPVAAIKPIVVDLGRTPKGVKQTTLVMGFDTSGEAIRQAEEEQAAALAARKSGGRAKGDGVGSRKPPNKVETEALECIAMLLQDPERHHIKPDWTGVEVIPERAIREAFYAVRGHDEADTKGRDAIRTAYGKAMAGLKGKGFARDAKGGLEMLEMPAVL